jgi:hypothetical protein
MAYVRITDYSPAKLLTIAEDNSLKTLKVVDHRAIRTLEVLDVGSARKSKIVENKKEAKVRERLPFYIRLENVKIPGEENNRAAPIGIAVIGFNNYIL